MRLTLTLCKQPLRWQSKMQWKARGHMKDPPRYITPVVAGKNVTLVDPNESCRQSPPPQWIPPVPDDPRFSVDVPQTQHPDYHEDPVYRYSPSTTLLEGEKQALLLTKTQPFYELPKSITDLVGKVEIKDQDKLIQRYIMQSNVWDPTKEKLPKRFNNEIPGWKFKREFGIPKRKRISILLSNMLRLSQSLCGIYPELLTSRRQVHSPNVHVIYDFRGDSQVEVLANNEWLIGTKDPLPNFASEDLVDKSAQHILPDIFPVLPTIDLEKTHVYKDDNVTGFSSVLEHLNPHTLYISDSVHWQLPYKNARALMYCFAHTAAHAKKLYGLNVKTLPKPVNLQCVMSDGVNFHFICYQLNTLNLDTADGIKNMMWIENNQPMYNKIEPKRAMLRNTKYEDYDPEVFKKFLAMHINGVNLGAQQERVETKL